MMVVKPLYSIAEAGTYWWATYSRHYKEKLGMVTSTYNSCLLVTNNSPLGIIDIQTDNTVILEDNSFNDLEL